jgi:hypothetical protein
MTPEERAALRAEHVVESPERHARPGTDDPDDPHCDSCWEDWPCTVVRLLDDLDAAHSSARTTRNRRAKGRGASFERKVAGLYGGRRTGPLLGRDDVTVGEVFAIQTKRALRLSLNEARQYLDDLAGLARIPVVIHALPGERGGVVIWRLSDHVAMHGNDAIKPEDAA